MASKARGNTTFSYNSVALAPYATSVTYSAAGETIDITNLTSTAQEFLQDVVTHEITLAGNWAVALDTALQPEVGLGTARTAVLVIGDGTSTVTYTWTSKAECSAYDIDMSVGSVGTYSATITLSGAPSSRVVA